MLTKDVTLELESILSAIVDDGKEPSVALVKARLSTPVPLPAIIATIKSWKSTKRVPKVQVSESDKDNNEQRLSQLEQQVTLLLARVESLEKQLRETE